MAQITLTGVNFAGGVVPAAIMTGVIVRHRLTADPDVIGSYTTDTTTAVLLTNGTFQAPVVITGLLNSTEYTVWVKPPCGPGAKVNYTTPGPSCVDVVGIIGTVSE